MRYKRYDPIRKSIYISNLGGRCELVEFSDTIDTNRYEKAYTYQTWVGGVNGHFSDLSLCVCMYMFVIQLIHDDTVRYKQNAPSPNTDRLRSDTKRRYAPLSAPRCALLHGRSDACPFLQQTGLLTAAQLGHDTVQIPSQTSGWSSRSRRSLRIVLGAVPGRGERDAAPLTATQR